MRLLNSMILIIGLATLGDGPQGPDKAVERLRVMRAMADGITMKELVRQIKAHELYKPDDRPSLERYELRVLPQPVYRYADEGSGLIDGGMFIISYGLNPEAVMLVEAHRQGSSMPVWHFGFARIAIAEIHVAFENKEIWSHRGGYSRGPDDPYWTFVKPILGE